MQPTQQYLSEFLVSGLKVRTNNSDESQASRAKIGSLWQNFYQQDIAATLSASGGQGIYGVYSAYQSDANGDFDVTAGVQVSQAATNLSQAHIAAGQYLVFPAKGPLPAAVIDTWGQIWHYFAQNPDIERAYISDFEHYVAQDEALIYIGIKSSV